MGPNYQNPYAQYGNQSQWSPWASIAAGIAGMNQSNPADAAQPYLQNAQNDIQSGFNPYIQAGQQVLPTLQNQYGQLTNNPGGFINNMGQGFQQSPGYQFQVQQNQNAVNRAAAAGGQAGSPMEQQNMAQVTNQLANQDYYNWMDHAMNAYGMGLQGEQGLYNTGFNASSQSAEDQAQIAQSQAQLAYAGQINQNQAQQGGWGAIAGGIGQLFGGGFGGSQGGSQGGSSPNMSDYSWLADLAQYV